MLRAFLILFALALTGPVAAQTTTSGGAAAPQTGAGASDPAAPQTGAGATDPAAPQTGATDPATPQTGAGGNDPATPQTGATDPAAPQAGAGATDPAAPQTGATDPAAPQTGATEAANPTAGETSRPEPASPEGIKGLENPDAAAFAHGRENNTSLLADRQAPSAYPTLDAPDDSGAALDGDAGDLPDDRALFTALAAQNCRIAARDVAEVLAPQGFDPQSVTRTLATLYIEGAASMDAEGNLTLPAALCPPDEPAPSPRDAVIAALRDNGCTADEATMRAAPGVSDLSDAQLLAILGPMRETGEIETGPLSATLSQELCQED